MPYGIRTLGKLNEVYVNMRTFTPPEALKAIKIFRLQGVYGVCFFYEPSLSFVKWDKVLLWCVHDRIMFYEPQRTEVS